jgi:mannose-6-phosphate isomerase-like protein (cupin superfamily)
VNTRRASNRTLARPETLNYDRTKGNTKEIAMADAAPQSARTPGAKRAGPGEYIFNLASVNHILGGPDYSTANGACVEGDRMIVGLMRMPAGTGAAAHSHPNEQWIYILEGTFHATVGDKTIAAKPGSVVYVPADVVHSGKAGAEADVVFFTVKDASHSLHGIKA